MSKAKAAILPNECSWIRWLLVILLCELFGVLITVPIVATTEMKVDIFAGTPFAPFSVFLQSMLGFIGLFWGAIIGIRFVAKTPILTFIRNEENRLTRKTCLIILGLYAVGLVLTCLSSIGHIYPRTMQANDFLLYLVTVILLLWMQTTYEELIFRGIFIRFACKNDIRLTGKSFAVGIVSSALFMAMHLANPEVLAQSGVEVVLSSLSYFLSGAALYFIDIYFKSLVPGILIHWLNNFTAFALLSGEISAASPFSLFIDGSTSTGTTQLLSVILVYVPIFAYIAYKHMKSRKAISA